MNPDFPNPGATDAIPATILAVDDSAESLALVGRILTSAGHRVRLADSGELALAAIEASPPDLIVLDLKMPGIDGLEVCRRLKARPETRGIPIILLSAYAGVKEWVEGLQIGAADHIGKPVQAAELLTRVDTQLALARASSVAAEAQAQRRLNAQLEAEVLRRQQIEGELRENLNTAQRIRQALLSALEDRQRTEAALRESEAKFRSYVDYAPVGVLVADRTGRHLEANRAAEEMLGYPPGGLVGTFVADLPALEDGASAARHFATVTTTGLADDEFRLRRRDGSVIWARIRAVRVNEDRFLAILEDTSRRRQLELEREQLIRALERKNRELENLVYVASHDLRSPLLNIQGFSQRIAEACTEVTRLTAQDPPAAGDREALAAILNQKLPRAIGFIGASVEKMDRLINGLLRLSRLGTAGLMRESIEMNELITELLGTMAFALEEAGATAEIGPLPPCHGDAGQISQLFSNLLDNALKYRDATRPLRISITGRSERQRAVYCVADTGRGLAPEHWESIWEIFFRVEPGGAVAGDGLGLNLVRRVAERHQGEVWVKSTPGKGSHFFVALPLPEGNPSAAPVR